MSRLLSRRSLFGAGLGATAVAVVGQRSAAAVPAGGQLVTFRAPIRVYDSRVDTYALQGRKLASGESVAVTVSAAFADIPSGFAESVFVNCTVTGTEGSGYLVVRGSDLSGEVPLPPTSNINWTGPNQTLANLVLTTVGGENALEVHCAGGGRTHVVVDVQGYVPYVL